MSRFGADVATTCYVQVCTAQYFVWWFGILPLVSPQLNITWSNGVVVPVLLWVLAQIHWLAWAYLLEFTGRSVHLQVWVASVAMLVATVHLMCCFIARSKSAPFANNRDCQRTHAQ